MNSGWVCAEWGDLATLQYGRSLRGYEGTNKPFRVYGTNGPIGTHDVALSSGPTVVVGRKGAYRGIHFSSAPCYVIDTAFYLTPRVDLDMRWAYYALLTHDINGMDSGSAIPSTSREAFYRLPVLVPPLHEQSEISSMLGALDDKIELNQKMSATLEAMPRALFKSWFADFEPIRAKVEGRDTALAPEIAGMFPDSFEMSEIGQIPKGWAVRAIGDIADIVGGSTPKTSELLYWDGPYAWATPKDLADLDFPVLLRTQRSITEAGLSTISSGLLPVGTILLSSRAPIGYLAVADIPVAINQGFIAMKPRAGISKFFLLWWAQYAHDAIIARANGSTFLEISKTNFRPIAVVVPPATIMQAFDATANSFYQRLVCAQRESRTLAALRDTLLPKLISGEIRVADAERIVAKSA